MAIGEAEFRRVRTVIFERGIWPYRWLAVGLVTGVCVLVAYLHTHPYPAYAGGLFLVMAKQIAAHGYHLPTTIPLYTETGIPFGYPPLMFYVTAVIHDLTGFQWLTISRHLPGMVVIAYLIPFYGIAARLLGTPRRAGLATVLFASNPTALRWHLSSGGLVRAPAMLLALCGIYVGLRLFIDGDRRWLAPGTVLFGLTVLTHPTYSVFFGLSYLLLYLFFDRTRAGLLAGAIVAAGGLLFASPWWLTVLSRHGPDIFITASGTHSGIAGGLRRLVVKLGLGINELNAEMVLYVLAYSGGIYMLIRRSFFLPAWGVASSYVVGKNRFLFVAGSMVTAVFLLDVVVPAVRAKIDRPTRHQAITAALIVLIVLSAIGIGVLTGASALSVAHDHSASQPQPMDHFDRSAMEWVATNTDPAAEFYVLGDPGEWFPLFTNRTIVFGPWGWEWKKTAGYYEEFEYYDHTATCNSALCLTTAIERRDRDPKYVYIPTGEYTVRGRQFTRDPEMRDSLIRSGRYGLVYENPGVMIFSVRDGRPSTWTERATVSASARDAPTDTAERGLRGGRERG